MLIASTCGTAAGRPERAWTEQSRVEYRYLDAANDIRVLLLSTSSTLAETKKSQGLQSPLRLPPLSHSHHTTPHRNPHTHTPMAPPSYAALDRAAQSQIDVDTQDYYDDAGELQLYPDLIAVV